MDNDNTPAAPAAPEAAAPLKPCPVCGKAADAKMKPFCSPRCADVDLHRWLAGNYAIPAAEAEADEAE